MTTKSANWFLLIIAGAMLFAAYLSTGCVSVGPLDTVNKRFAAFEVSYKSALTEISNLERDNLFKPETRTKVAGILEDVNQARKAAYLAKDSGDIINAQDKLSLAIALLDKLKSNLPKGGQI